MRRVLPLLGTLTALALAPAAEANPTMYVGAAEDNVKRSVLVDSKANFELAAAAGMNAIRITALWSPGLREPNPDQLAVFRTTARAAELTGIRVIVAAYPDSNRGVPLTDASRDDFASFVTAVARAAPNLRDFIIGNEPNLNFFWLPQYNADGSSASPGAYVQLLARSYDALKAADPTINVVGGSVSPRGTDKPNGLRPTHSPGNFIVGMGEAYRASGRAEPIMDQFAFHPYGEKSSSPPAAKHPRSTTISLNDYDKLVGFLGRAFDGSLQKGSTLPIVYDEYGVQSAIPPSKLTLYTEAASPAAADAVTEETQASYYREALQLAYCQPNVQGFLFFHTVDEADMRRWQSGIYYPDGTPKSSFGRVRDAVLAARRGSLAVCPGVRTPVQLLTLRFPTARRVSADNRVWRATAKCAGDCAYVLRLERLPGHSTVLAKSGILAGGRQTAIRLPSRRVAPGRYRFTLRLVSRFNPGDPLVKAGPAFRVG